MLRPKELVAKMKSEAEALMGTLKPAVIRPFTSSKCFSTIIKKLL